MRSCLSHVLPSLSFRVLRHLFQKCHTWCPCSW
ncbi:Uncharacterised protein [Vibrio cholerae]|nr:Uncharacterised protein [Vibrio cholerae]